MLLGLDLADFLVIIVYLVVVTFIGVWSARKVKNMADFFMPRRFGKTMMVLFSFGTGTHADQAVSVASKSYSNGLSGIWYQWLWLFATPFYWLIAPVMRRFRALTTADVFEARYSKGMSMLYALIGSLNMMVSIGVMLKGAGAIIAASTGSEVSADYAIIFMTVLFVVYGVAGGLGAAIITDFIQGILTLVLSFILLPMVMSAVGGLEGLHEKISDPQMFSLVAPAEIGFFYIMVIAINALVGIVTQPHIMGNCAAGRTELEGQIGFMGGNFLKRICTIAWCLTGFAGVAYFMGNDIEPDHIYGLLARGFLPKIMPGLVGLFLASVLASVMSSCDAFMISSSALFTENLYKRMVKDKSEKHYLNAGRLISFAMVAGGVLFAFKLKSVIEGLEIFWMIPAMMAIAFWLGLLWRRATVAAAWASTLTALGMWWLTARSFFPGWLATFPISDALRIVVEKDGDMTMYLPWKILFYLVPGFAVGIIVSFFTKPVSEEKLDRFYALTRTPIRPGEQVEQPCTLPEGSVVPPSRLLFPNSRLEIPIPTFRAIAGFIIGWILVVAIIGFFFWLTQT